MLSNASSILLIAIISHTFCALAHPQVSVRTEIVPPLPSSLQVGGMHEESWQSLLKRQRRNVDEMLMPRQEVGNEPPPANTINLEQWEIDTRTKCIERFRTLAKASNPSGIAVCYNIPFTDPSTGVFAADLRLYQISPPEADWVGVVGTSIGIGLEYEAAIVQETNLRPNTTLPPLPPNSPEMVRLFHFLGLIKPDFRNEQATDEQMRALIVPLITLKAKKSDGTPLEAALTTSEASFLVGELTVDSPLGPTGPIEQKSFELPGRSIAVFPVGLIFYGTYMVVGVSIVIYGTFERRQFRDHYRARLASSPHR